MSHTFNLSVKDYEIRELKELLNLNEPYTLEDIVNNQTELQEKLLMDTGISQEKKTEIINFLEEVKNILIRHSKKEFEKLTKDSHNLFKKRNLLNDDNSDKIIYKKTANNIISKLVSLDSRFRENYNKTSSSNYNIILPTVLKNVVSMQLGSIEIPGTFYQITRELENNYFWIEKDTNKYYIEIPEGNYDRIGIQKTINNQISTTDISNTQIIISDKNGKTFFITKNEDISFNLYFNKQPYTTFKTQKVPDDYEIKDAQKEYGLLGGLGWILGFRQESYLPLKTHNEGNNTVNDTLKLQIETELDYSGDSKCIYSSEGCYDGWGSKYLYLVVNDFNKSASNVSITNYNSSLGNTHILARISTSSASSNNFKNGSIIQKGALKDDYSIRKRDYFGPVNITKINIQLLDDIGRIINLNNMDFSFSLNIECLYD
tara:strand:- start:2633 stop:3925 length:1293 start_codon:yes stop_codon:yes gene_type:complete